MPCNCGKTTKCVTQRCECNAEDEYCTSKCGCGLNCCENLKSATSIDASEDSDDDRPIIPKSQKTFKKSNILPSDNDSDDQNEFISVTIRELRMPVTNKREDVLKYRKGKDIYTQKKESEIENPHVDHIIEDQIMAHAMHGF